jgi:hypothetical protein
MESTDFIDYYEVLEISPNANSGTIERMFRHLAARYHPEYTAEVSGGGGGVERDLEIQNNLLSMLYVKRRQNVGDAGIGDHELERMLDCTHEQLEFQFWYMKEKGWLVKTENGMLAIRAAGVDRVNSEHREKATNKLITDQSYARRPVMA